MENPIHNAVLMCHAPIVIPEIAGDRANSCVSSTNAMVEIAQHCAAQNPDTIVVLSPHTPRIQNSFGVLGGHDLRGSFYQFGYPELHCHFPNHHQAIPKLLSLAHDLHFPLEPLPALSLDHGALVPLYFLSKTTWKGRVLVISLPYSPSHQQCQSLGNLLKKASHQLQEKWLIVASGDMSHRLIPGAPAGYHPNAKIFDQSFTEQIKNGSYRTAVAIDPDIRDLAAEDVVDTSEIAMAATDFTATGHQVLSYEGPFGVGYLIAILHHSKGAGRD